MGPPPWQMPFVAIEIERPNTKIAPAIQTGVRSIVLLRVTGNFDDGTRVAIFDSTTELRKVNFGLFKDGPQSEVELVGLFRHLSSETLQLGWIYFILKPGTHYLVFVGTGYYEMYHRLHRARLWQIVLPKDTPIVYVGSMHLSGWRLDRPKTGYGSFNENKMFLRNEESLAKQLAANYLSEFGPVHTVLMKPYD